MQTWHIIATHSTYWGCYFLGLVVAFLLTPVVIKIAKRYKIVDVPAHRKVHKRPTPLLGGAAIFAGVWIPLLLLQFRDNLVTSSLASGGWAKLYIIFQAGLAMLLVGMLDDMRGLRARWKFLFQVPVAIGLVMAGVRFDYLVLPYAGVVPLGDWGAVLSVVFLVGMTNALNLIDGIDGLATGVAFVVSGTNAILATMNGNTLLAVVMWSMAGACLGFLRYNFSPAQVFLGDTGSLFLGMTLAATSIVSVSKGPVTAGMLIPVLLLGYPATDTLLAMARRAYRGKAMFSSDKGHIHHRLLAQGYGHGAVALVLYLVCGVFCAVGLAGVVGSDLLLALGLVCIVGLFVFGLWALGYMRHFSRAALRERPYYRIAYHYAEMAKNRLILTRTCDEVWGVIRDAARDLGMAEVSMQYQPSPFEPAFKAECEFPASAVWDLKGSAGELGERHVRDQYQFEEAGLAVTIGYWESKHDTELQTERRLLLGEMMQDAARHLISLPGPDRRSSAPHAAAQTPPSAGRAAAVTPRANGRAAAG